jgi:hypothetical protein
MCGLLVERAEELARLYRAHGNWNDVKQIWFDDRLSDRSTRDSSQKIFRVLTARLKNAPTTLPNASDLPLVLDACSTPRDKAQLLYLYLVEDDAIVRYVIHEYANRLSEGRQDVLDFSNDTLDRVFGKLEFDDGEAWGYADSTTERWYEGFRSVMRQIGVLENQRAVDGTPPTIGDIPLLVALGYSYDQDREDWLTPPRGLLYLFQPQSRWNELYDRAVESGSWEYVELHGNLRLQPVSGEPYSWIESGGPQ